MSFVGGWGHAEPLLEAARLAHDRGHRVVFAGQAAIVPRLASLGFETVTVGPDTISADRSPLLAPDRELERRVMREHFVTAYGWERAASLTDVLADLRPELLVCDQVDVGALVAAERAGVPAVTVDVIAAGRLVGPAVVGAAWTRLREAHGLGPDPDGLRLGGSLAIAPFPASFRDPDLPTPPQWRPVRPAVGGLAEPGRRRTIYATLGTVFNVESGDLLSRVVGGLELLDLDALDALVTVGPNILPGEFASVDRRVRIEQFVPQREVLGRCAAVVCHGGSGTLMAALSHAVPVVLLPMGADQLDNADRCEALGCGVVLDPVATTPHDIAAAIGLVIGDPSFGLAAGRLADEAAQQTPLDELDEFMRLLDG